MSLDPPMILIVDDDAELAAMLVKLLSREGWVTRTALSTAAAESAMRLKLPEIVLLDAMLPDGN